MRSNSSGSADPASISFALSYSWPSLVRRYGRFRFASRVSSNVRSAFSNAVWNRSRLSLSALRPSASDAFPYRDFRVLRALRIRVASPSAFSLALFNVALS